MVLDEQPVPPLVRVEALHETTLAIPLGLAAQALHDYGRAGVQTGSRRTKGGGHEKREA